MHITRLTLVPVLLLAAIALGGGRGVPGAGIASAAVPQLSNVILSAAGNGISNTRRFRVPATWRILYSYSHCEIPGLDIYVKGGPGDIASDARSGGTGIQYEYGAGNVYLTMNTACSWHVTVQAGRWVTNGPGLRLTGNSITNTIAFHVPSNWQIHYQYSHCDIPGFDIYVQGSASDIMSRNGKSGHGVQYEHQGGIVWLEVNTACYWQLSITR